MPRVLVIDPLVPGDIDLERATLGPDVEITCWRPSAGEPTPKSLAGYDAVLLFRSRHRVTAEQAAAMTGTKLIVQAGVGFNHIDLDACAKAGIAVCNTPDYGTMEVADHAIALMLTLMRGTAAYNARLLARDNAWNTDTLALGPVRRLRGLTFGVVGLGRIGLSAALKARAFALEVAFHDPWLPAGAELSVGFARADSLHALLARSDIVSIHCPLNAETTGLFNQAAFAACRKGVVLVNTARGPIVELSALEAALRSGQVGAAGLDVLPEEPMRREHPLLQAWTAGEPWLEGRFILTPHAAFYSPEGMADMRRLSSLTVRRFFDQGTYRALVNGPELKAHGRM